MVGVKAPEDADRCEAMLTPEQKVELRDELARELDAAGVRPEIESGKPKAAPAKEPAKQDAAKKPEPAMKKSKSRSKDPCEGGE